MAIKTIHADKMRVKVYATRAEMGRAAGEAAAARLRELLSEKSEVNVIFAAAPSQNETLAALVGAPGIEWGRVNAFHMDEYIGLDRNAPQCFGNFLDRQLFSLVPFKSVNRINPEAPPANRGAAASDAVKTKECDRYSDLLTKFPPDLVCLGIGENAHIAFNDPGEARFDDSELVKVVTLDEVCRKQQVHDGCFASLDAVPTHALTLTIPALMRAPHLICTVPAATKRDAVTKTVTGPVTEAVPATAMRLHSDCTLFCDAESGADL